jgi:signal transduction histidine kinase/DNA-binding response OmpR family regulator/HAMP domain-containing protein
MLERLKFRYKVFLLVAPTLAGLLLVTAVSLLLNRQAERQLAEVQDTYLPLLEADRDLKRLFREIQHALEGAAAAQEVGNLREADGLRKQFIERVASARSAIAANGGDSNALEQALESYYGVARDVTTQLMAGREGEALVGRIEQMRLQHQNLHARLEATTTPNRTRMVAAFRAARQAHSRTLQIDVLIAVLALVLAGSLSWRIIRGAVRRLQQVQAGMERLAGGDFSHEIKVTSQDEFGDLARQANETAARLRGYRENSLREDWVKTGLSGLASELVGELAPSQLCSRALAYLARYLDAQVAAAFLADGNGDLQFCAGVACVPPGAVPSSFRPGEGLLGQAALDGQMRVLDQSPPGHLAIRSALIDAAPKQIVVIPFAHERRTIGVLELGSKVPWSEQQLEVARGARTALGGVFAVARSRQRQQELLERSQRQADELQSQQEELRQTNDELAEQSRALEQERQAVLVKNAELEKAQALLQEKAEEVSRSSRYKSEFLANMSHELRTPLNGIMVLSQMLGENLSANLSDKQVEFARVIHQSGEELLNLINEVLDLSKVEAGRQELVLDSFDPADLVGYLRGMFGPLAARKGLAFSVEQAGELPPRMRTDRARVEQILKNLLSNALKFTEGGNVTVTIGPAPAADVRELSGAAGSFVAFSVSDTGMGIPADKQEEIFEAFAQVDRGTSRKYGGTGLGLAIAKKLAARMGGDLRVRSDGATGSTFTLFLPFETRPAGGRGDRAADPVSAVADDRDHLQPGDPALLLIEDDADFAQIVVQMVREAGFKALHAKEGHAGLELARQYRPSGIILDVGLPDMDGWAVMERLAADQTVRNIPVHFVTAAAVGADRARTLGAVGFLSKPFGRDQLCSVIHNLEESAGIKLRKILLVEDDAPLRTALSTLLTGKDMEVAAVGSSAEALEQLRSRAFGCMILDLGLPDKQSGLDLLRRVRRDRRTRDLPVIVHTGLSLSEGEVLELERQARTVVVVKGERSPQRLIDEARLFVQRLRRDLPAHRQLMNQAVQGDEPSLRGKKILIVDDDMRNVYSLSAFLSAKGLLVEVAPDGKSALDMLANDGGGGIELVLMDIMMPGLDGYEAMRRIRTEPRFGKLPIIALTAKAMPGDREKCLAAGASDYIAKPVDTQKFMSALRGWLGPGTAAPGAGETPPSA